MLLLEAWRTAEAASSSSSNEHVQAVEARMPKRVKMRRPVLDAMGREVGMEEYYEYQFPDDEKKIGKFYRSYICNGCYGCTLFMRGEIAFENVYVCVCMYVMNDVCIYMYVCNHL